MHIKEMIEELGGNRKEIAKQAGISEFDLNNRVSRGVQVELLADGRWVSVRRDTAYFGEKKQ